MPIDGNAGRRVARLEAALLVLAAPFLLFPSLQPLVTAVTLLLLMLGWLVAWRVDRFPLSSTPFNAAFLFFACALLVSILVTADPDLTSPKATGMILALAAWRYLAHHVTSRRALLLAFIAFAALGLGMTSIGVISADWQFEVPFVESLFRLLPPQLVALPGAEESGVHTNQLAGTLLFYCALPLAYILDVKRFAHARAVALVAGASLFFVFALLLLTQSRSAWMGAVAGVASLFFAWSFLRFESPRARRWLLLALLTCAVVLLVLVILFWPTLVAALYEDPPDSTPIGTLQTIAFRYEVWRWALTAIGDFPFTGIGLGSFQNVVLRLYPIYYATPIAHAHNAFIQVAVDVGLPGLASYLSIMMLAVWTTFEVSRRDRQLRPLVLGLLAGLVAFHVYGITDTLAFGSKSGIALWISVGLLCAAWRVSKEQIPGEAMAVSAMTSQSSADEANA